MLQTYRHQTSDIQTYRPSDEAGPRGAFAPKNMKTAKQEFHEEFFCFFDEQFFYDQ